MSGQDTGWASGFAGPLLTATTPGRRTASRLAAAPDTGPAARRLLLAAEATPGDRGHARVRIGGGAG
jgi:hypothetical protein